ncbi:MAG: hypothetical protein C4563_09605 [Desulfobulbus sp.]|nr:MAG: hypothetical protein C4563_09605 [Desulfobulbus sp.]
MSAQTPQPDSSRRRFLSRQLKWLLAGTIAVLATPLLRFAGFTVKPKPRHVIVNKPLLPGSVHTDHDFLLIAGETGVLAVSRRCTHLGCRVNFRLELGIIECPCHQSRFSPAGIRQAGPARKDLPTYPVRLLKDDQGKVTGYEVTL